MMAHVIKHSFATESKNEFIIPINKQTNNKTSRYVLEIEKDDYSIHALTIIIDEKKNELNTHTNSDNDFSLLESATNLSPSKLLKYLRNILNDNIPNNIIQIIVSFCPFNESIIGVSFAINMFKNDKLNEIYQYLYTMNETLKDVRSISMENSTIFGIDMNNVIGKVYDIIDPSLFVKCIDDNNKYQWIPSTIKIIDDKLCKIKIISSINRFQKSENNNYLFNIYESVISKMLPHFEDVTEKKLIKNDNKLQIICKAIQYELKKGRYYGTHWHFEGIADIEHVIAVGILYTHNELIGDAMIQNGNLEFSMNIDMAQQYGDKYRHKGNGKHFSIATNAGNCIVWNNQFLQHRLGYIVYDDIDDPVFNKIMGFEELPTDEEEDDDEEDDEEDDDEEEDNEEHDDDKVSDTDNDDVDGDNDNDTDDVKTRQAIICMLIDPNYKIYTEQDSYFNISLNEAKETRIKVRNARKATKSRDYNYCFDCGNPYCRSRRTNGLSGCVITLK